MKSQDQKIVSDESRCDGCGEQVRTNSIDGMNLCIFCYANYLHEGMIERDEKMNKKEVRDPRINFNMEERIWRGGRYSGNR